MEQELIKHALMRHDLMKQELTKLQSVTFWSIKLAEIVPDNCLTTQSGPSWGSKTGQKKISCHPPPSHGHEAVNNQSRLSSDSDI